MTLARLVAATAAVLTALLLQASVIAPVTGSSLLSLPAILVAAIALRNGPGAAISVGFSAGLLADLGSDHPAGVLALIWLGLGLVCARIATACRGRRAEVLAVAVLGLGASVLVAVLLTALGTAGSTISQLVGDLIPAVLGYLLLAAVVVPVVGAASGAASLRPAPGGGAPGPAAPTRPLGLARTGRSR